MHKQGVRTARAFDEALEEMAGHERTAAAVGGLAAIGAAATIAGCLFAERGDMEVAYAFASYLALLIAGALATVRTTPDRRTHLPLRIAHVAMALAVMIGTVLLIAPASLDAPLLLAYGLLVGSHGGTWWNRYRPFGKRIARPLGGAGLFSSLAALVALTGMRPWLQHALLVVLPVVSLLGIRSKPPTEEAPVQSQASANEHAAAALPPWRLLVCPSAIAFVAGAALAFSPERLFPEITFPLGAAGAALLLIGQTHREVWVKCGATLLYRFCFVSLAVALLLQLVPQDIGNGIGAVGTRLAGTAISLSLAGTLMGLFSDFVQLARAERTSRFSIALTLLLFASALAFGALAAGCFPSFVGRDAWTVALVLLLALSMLPLSSKGALSQTERKPDVPAAAPVSVQSTDRGRTVHTLAETYQLTPREQALLAQLADGRSLPASADALDVSLNTVKSHAKALYAKCGVHSRQELLDLIEATAPQRA